MYEIGFIGFGNMAKAICAGLLKANLVKPADICAYDVFDGARESAAALDIAVCKSESDVVSSANYVFLCVKPQSFTEVLSAIRPYVNLQKHVFLSIAAGITTASIQQILGEAALIRAMPNTPLLLASGTTALCKTPTVSNAAYAFIKRIFASVGTVYELPENKFNEVINVNGSTPAYVYFIADIVAQYAQKNGIAYSVALDMFCDTLIGSAQMMKESGKTPQELMDMVSSKGGTTVAALDAFRENGLEIALSAGMDACLKRAYELNL